MKQDMIVILDLGSSENTKLARDIREMGVYSEIYPHDITAGELKALPNVKGVIINGGPNHVVDGVSIDVLPEIYEAGFPVMAADHASAACECSISSWDGDGAQVLRSFVFDTCGAQANWNMKNFISDQVELIREQVGNRKVLLALSGGVDSSVVAALLIKAIGRQLTCVHVNHGLMRKGESESVIEVFKNQMDANLVYVDAVERFLGKLEGVADPEQKRKIIGAEFIRVFEEEARKLEGIDFLAQGTIYPDIVESGTKTAKVVKSHHNVGGLPEDLDFTLVEPLRQLFKDEVRACGLERVSKTLRLRCAAILLCLALYLVSAFLAMRLPENAMPVCPSITSFARSQAWAMTGGSSTTTAFSPPTESMLRWAAQRSLNSSKWWSAYQAEPAYLPWEWPDQNAIRSPLASLSFLWAISLAHSIMVALALPLSMAP